MKNVTLKDNIFVLNIGNYTATMPVCKYNICIWRVKNEGGVELSNECGWQDMTRSRVIIQL